MTHTYVVLEVPQAMFDFVTEKMNEAGYQHALHKDGEGVDTIDMHGLGLQVNTDLQSISKPVAMIESEDARKLADDLEKLWRAHWTHWNAQESHIAATAVRHLRLLAEEPTTMNTHPTPLTGAAGCRYITEVNAPYEEGRRAFLKGTANPYPPYTIESLLHSHGWLMEDLRQALIKADPAGYGAAQARRVHTAVPAPTDLQSISKPQSFDHVGAHKLIEEIFKETQSYVMPPLLRTKIAAFLAEPSAGCDFCMDPLYAGTKCKNCGRITP